MGTQRLVNRMPSTPPLAGLRGSPGLQGDPDARGDRGLARRARSRIDNLVGISLLIDRSDPLKSRLILTTPRPR